MAISQQTFPGVYTTIRDDSFTTNLTSRFRVGLVGVARKGPFNAVVTCRSLKDFRANFGPSLSGYYLANAAAMVSDFTDGVFVVRVGRQYNRITTGVSGGGDGDSAYQFYTPNAKLFTVGDYVRVSQGGKKTTVNAQILDYIPSGDQANATGIQLVSEGTDAIALADTYNSATVDSNAVSGAASNAEAFLYAYEYTTALSGLGTASGDKSAFSFVVTGTVLPTNISGITRSGATATAVTDSAHGLTTGNQITITGANEDNFNGVVEITAVDATTFTYEVEDSGETTATGSPQFVSLVVGDIIRLKESNKIDTVDAQVKEIKADGTIVLEPTSIAEQGYTAVSLQDSYSEASVFKVKYTAGVPNQEPIMHLIASTAGTWANSDGVSSGLIVTMAPGSNPGTKKMLVYEDSALVETIDNLSTDPDSSDYYVTRINDRSGYVAVPTDDLGQATGILSMSSGTVDEGEFIHPANTRRPWNTANYPTVNFATFGNTSRGWGPGYNGEAPDVDEVIGTVDPNTDEATGIKLFENTDDLELHVICAPGITDMAVQYELSRVARAINAIAFGDIPDSGTVGNPRQAIDWHNGEGLFSDRSRIDSPNLALYFNWFEIIDQFTGENIFVPPTLAILKTTARCFDREKPWFAAAGENRGIIEEALSVRFPRISKENKAAMYGNGNSVNPILFNRGRRMVFGNRTMQVDESKLTAVSNVILTNYVVNGMAAIARRFVFDPNDAELLLDLRNALTKLLDSVKAERGIEDYSLDISATAEQRNAREVEVAVEFIPVDPVEKIFINATVKESGAVLTGATRASA